MRNQLKAGMASFTIVGRGCTPLAKFVKYLILRSNRLVTEINLDNIINHNLKITIQALTKASLVSCKSAPKERVVKILQQTSLSWRLLHHHAYIINNSQERSGIFPQWWSDGVLCRQLDEFFSPSFY